MIRIQFKLDKYVWQLAKKAAPAPLNSTQQLDKNSLKTLKIPFHFSPSSHILSLRLASVCLLSSFTSFNFLSPHTSLASALTSTSSALLGNHAPPQVKAELNELSNYSQGLLLEAIHFAGHPVHLHEYFCCMQSDIISLLVLAQRTHFSHHGKLSLPSREGSFSSSFDEYSNFCERLDRKQWHHSSCCGCCNCCALSTYRTPVKPSPLCGLRQSILLQFSASRRLLLGGGDEYFFQLPAYGLSRVCYELNYSVKKRNGCNKSRRRRERCFSLLSEKGGEIHHSSGADDAETILSLLTEDVDVDFIGVKGKNVSSFKRLELEKKRKNGNREKILSLGKEIKVEKQGSLKHHDTFNEELRKGDEISNERREAITKCGNNRKQRNISNCSSYYSFSSSQDFGSDLEVQDKHRQHLEELLQGYEKDEAHYMEGQVKEELNRRSDGSEKMEETLNEERIAFDPFIDRNLRKESEKKLTEVTMEETESRRLHLGMHSQAFRTNESSYGKASSFHKKFDSEEYNSASVKDLDMKTRQANIQKENRRKYKSTEVQECGGDELETTSKSQKAFSGRGGNLEISEKLSLKAGDNHQNIVCSITGKDEVIKNSKKNIEKSKIQDAERTSNSKMRNLGENKVSILSSVQGIEEQHHQKEKKIIAQVEERRKSQQFTELQVQNSNVENIINSSTRIQNFEENLNFSSDANGTFIQTDQKMTRSIQPYEGSGFVNIISESYSGDKKQGSSSQRNSDKVRFIQKSKLTSVIETRESHCQTDDRITQFYSTSEAQRPKNLSITIENASERASCFQGSLNMVSEARKHVILAEGNTRSSEVMLAPCSSQLVVKGSSDMEPTTGTASPEVCPEIPESGFSALYDNSKKKGRVLVYEIGSRDRSDLAYSEPSNIISPEDALGSADCLEKSSKLFVEKVRHDAAPSEAQETDVTGTNLASKNEMNQLYSLRKHGTQNGSQFKEHGSSCSSGFSGTKGPSDETRDVTELSVKPSPIAEDPEISKETGKPIVKRTGRFLWNIVADVVRLRWASQPATSNSAARSVERSSSKKSDDETWSSRQGQEETIKSNVMMERISDQPQATTSIKLNPKNHDIVSERQVSDTKKSKDKVKLFEFGSSSTSTLESGSTSVDGLFASGEGNTNWTGDRKDMQVTPLGVENLEISIPLSAEGPSFDKEVVNADISDVPRTESLEEPETATQTGFSGTGGNDGEWKQKRVQRKKQVSRDRFEKLEEAYILEFEQRRLDEMFMREALLEAQKAADNWEVPIGAVLVQHGKIIARGCNLVEQLRDSTAHAEILCIREASNLLQTWRLAFRPVPLLEDVKALSDKETTLYVTLEPCPMCAGAILQARIDTLVWGAPNKLIGADGSWVRLFPDGGNGLELEENPGGGPVHPLHPKMKVRRGVLESQCANVMQQSFQLRRKMKKEEAATPPSKPSRFPFTRRSPKFLNKMHGIFHMIGF
ncbi:tRNA(adenine(34)) deaminase, chloroplastic [Senna tora]|uniref:tRNA(adenine(34)) deaminase n=1 Tax=Senna tora TaxID=362788 RepID=A0A834W7T7_9FABA|nr:tRNA(adenine(34)) deaminase, chloroplastic [Senna tora]